MNKTLLTFVLFLTGFTVSAQKSSQPNIIIILADDLGWGDVGFHGSEIKTPNLDKLSREGVILNRYYVSPICSPTRAGLMTGRYPDRFGLRQNVIAPWLNFGVDTTEEFLPQMLAQAGYKNRAALGKWHLGHAKRVYLPLSRGFTHFYGHYNGAIDYFTHEREGELDWHNDWATSYDKGYSTDLITNEAGNCIKKDKKDGPFFLYVAFNAPHAPLQAKEEDLKLYGYDPLKPKFGGVEGEGGDDATKGRGNTKRQTYSAMVTAMDRGIGKILETLKNEGLEKNTLVLFHSDNGAEPAQGGTSGELRGHKFQEWDGGVRAPAIIKWPDGFKGGRILEQLTGYTDIAPTLREIAEVKSAPPKKYDGISILPALKNDHKNIERSTYLGYGSIINGGWKLVKANSGNPKMELKEDMVFDILKDPSEKNNIRGSNQSQYEKLSAEAEEYDAIKPSSKVPPFGQGRKTFKAPKNWEIKD
ncbi:MAG: arylsulfatase [Sphingobacteriales bacterium 41-5]|nr:MAG: arylsulfatase [Sphingobacteriales bacterium 41-5]